MEIMVIGASSPGLASLTDVSVLGGDTTTAWGTAS